MTRLRVGIYGLLSGLWMLQALVPRSDLHQWVHWPDLLAHYESHQSQTDTSFANFWDFLVAHYFNGDNQPHPEHENLPLHHSHNPTYYLVTLPWQVELAAPINRQVFISRPSLAAAAGYPHTDPQPPQQA